MTHFGDTSIHDQGAIIGVSRVPLVALVKCAGFGTFSSANTLRSHACFIENDVLVRLRWWSYPINLFH